MTTETPAQLRDPKLKGYLVVFVDGYKVYNKYLVHLISDGERTISVPDRFVPPPDHEIGSMHWWMDGWAIGDNVRGRLCSRKGAKPLRRFRDFDEAVANVFVRQKKHKTHRHVLVYVTTGIGGKEQMEVVRSLDDIRAVDAREAAEIAKDDAALKRRQAATDAEPPHINALRDKYGPSAAWSLSNLAKDLREKGVEAVKVEMAASSYYRQVKRLREAGVEV